MSDSLKLQLLTYCSRTVLTLQNCRSKRPYKSIQNHPYNPYKRPYKSGALAAASLA